MSDDYAKIRELLFYDKLDEIVAYGAAAIPHLIDALMDEDVGVRANVAWVLSKIGDVSAVPALTEALKDKEWEVRALAAGALGKIAEKGGDCSAAVPALLDALKDGNPVVRKWAAEAVEKIAEKIVEKTEIDLRAVEKALREYVASVREKGNPAETRKAKEGASLYYMAICEAVRKHVANKHSLDGDGVILVGERLKPPSGRKDGMYRGAKQARVTA